MDHAKQAIQNEIDKLKAQITDNNNLLKSEISQDMKLLVAEELKTLESKILDMENSIRAMDGDFSVAEESESNEKGIKPNVAILEIRAGTGGDEAGLFALDLHHMYNRYAEKAQWKMTPIFVSENEAGGIKTASIKYVGKNVYPMLEHESGVHRVQRVPKTESAGRIHTSAATIAVMPELTKTEIVISPDELKWDFFRSGGKGGQNVNKVSTAVRVTHLPTGMAVECQEERTQGKNREKALGYLESRLYTMMQEQKVQKYTDLRAGQVGSGDRSEKIRTYNFPQDRVTDHRIGKNFHNIPAIMNGDIEKLLKTVAKELNKEETIS
jgi:peptide chain release factor 1